jgi:predicted nucleotidyltransferase
MVTMAQIEELCRRIAVDFNPLRILLFGSFAWGVPTSDSDVDLLVILQFEGKPLHKAVEILNRVAPRFPVDLVARRPEDTVRRYSEGDPLIREAIDKGKVMYERDHQGMERES